MALSLLFSFDCYFIEKSKSYALLADSARQLRALFRKQLEGKSLITTSTSKRFRREFCTDGVVLDPCGQILFSGEISKALEWADQNLEPFEEKESDSDSFEIGLKYQNSDSPESSADSEDDF